MPMVEVNGGSEFKARFTITGSLTLRGGDGGNYVYGALGDSFTFTDDEDLHIASYEVIQGNVTVTHNGNVWTFSNSEPNISWLPSNARSWTLTSVVEITFGR